MRKVVLATNNIGKAKELGEMLAGLDMQIVSQATLGVPEVEETGLTFIENAILKARNAAAYAKLPSIADDSGLEVDALDGAPGIHSARYAGPKATDQANMQKLLKAMEDVSDLGRSARFRCVIVYLKHAADPAPFVAEGVWEGSILRTPKGNKGFGYDPVFWVPEKGCASAELPPEVKNQLSHRGQALAGLLSHFRARH